MSTEETAWKAELVRELSKFDAYPDTWLPVVEPFIEAAEQRGREAALREAAQQIRDGRRARYDRVAADKAAEHGPLAVIAYAQTVIAEAMTWDPQ